MEFKLVCSDIDGTLLNKERVLSPKTIQTIKGMGDEVRVVLASSRMPAAMRHLQKDLGISGSPLICFNGGYVIAQEPDGRTIELYNAPIPIEVTRTAADFGREKGLHVGLYRADEWYVPSEDRWKAREERNTRVQSALVDSQALLGRWSEEAYGPHKIMCMGEPELVQGALELLQERHGDEVHLYRSKDTYLEISHKSISKAGALELVMDWMGDRKMEEVISFGDNYNDIDLLEASGWGVAVGNAREEVKAIANEITLPNIDDGVAAILEKYIS